MLFLVRYLVLVLCHTTALHEDPSYGLSINPYRFLLDGDPLSEMSDLMKVQLVVQGGRVVVDNR